MKAASGAGRIVIALLACLAGAIVVEIVVRISNLSPPTQIVRLLDQPRALRPSLRHGEPVWKAGADREHTRCAEQFPERTRILVFGDSITYGFALADTEVFTTLLEEKLNAGQASPGVCIMNFAQPGFGFKQSFAVAQDEIPRWKPALVLWESYGDDREYVLVDEAAYLVNPPYVGALARLAVRSDGSMGVNGVPPGVNHWLFQHSHAYEILALRWGHVEPVRPRFEERYPRLKALADAAGAKLVIYLATALDRPFAELARDPGALSGDVAAFTQRNAVPTYLLPRELIDEDYRALRLDQWCHFNAAGHRALAQRFQDIVLRELPKGATTEAAQHSVVHGVRD